LGQSQHQFFVIIAFTLLVHIKLCLFTNHLILFNGQCSNRSVNLQKKYQQCYVVYTCILHKPPHWQDRSQRWSHALIAAVLVTGIVPADPPHLTHCLMALGVRPKYKCLMESTVWVVPESVEDIKHSGSLLNSSWKRHYHKSKTSTNLQTCRGRICCISCGDARTVRLFDCGRSWIWT
jgi:hypothetical protein